MQPVMPLQMHHQKYNNDKKIRCTKNWKCTKWESIAQTQ